MFKTLQLSDDDLGTKQPGEVEVRGKERCGKGGAGAGMRMRRRRGGLQVAAGSPLLQQPLASKERALDPR